MINIKDKKFIKYSIMGFLSLIGFILLLSIILNIIPAYNIYKLSKSIQPNITLLEIQFNKKDFDNLKITIKKINNDSITLKQNLNNLKIITIISQISNNVESAKALSDIVTLATDSIIKVYPVFEEDYSILYDTSNVKIISMPKEKKAKIIASIYKIQPDLDEVNKNINKVLDLIKSNKDNKDTIKPIQDIWSKINSQYSNVEKIQKIFPLIKALPDLLGTPKNSKYLFLFENNTELRPTGGFIGSYGIVNISEGNIGRVFTDNIYNLDNANINRLKITPPEPIKEHLNQSYLYLRDANWNPDYEESANYLANLYKKESRNQYPITGVIALTPSAIQDIIGYFGEIDVMGTKFNKENATDLLNYETKFAYWETRGISESKRKIIIQKMADILFEKIKSLSLSKINDIANIIASNLDKKQILLYFNNKDAEQFAINNNWAGKMTANNNSDYFAVVDANLSSGKSDPYIDRNIDYDLRYVNNELVATLSLTYKHRYDDYIKNTIYQDNLSYVQEYKSYTRVYVPEGSKLNSLQIDDNPPSTDNIDFKNENGKTSFGFYMVIPKNETVTYKFEYIIPKELADKFEKEYSLIYQKQAGVYFNKINVNIDLNKAIESYSISNDTGLTFNTYNKKINFNGTTNSDRTIDVKFYSNSDIGYLQNVIKKNYLSFRKETPLGN